MKKIFLSFMLLTIFISNICFADLEEDDIYDRLEIEEYVNEVSASVSKEPTILSRAVVVLDRSSNTVIYEKNMNEKRAMASTTNVISYQR